MGLEKIPGTTTLDQLPIPDTYCLTPGVSGFAGGVSNGKIGASAFMQNQFGVRAEKSWFMFEGAVICLGNNISAEREGEVFTTVEQSFSKINWLIRIMKKLKSCSRTVDK